MIVDILFLKTKHIMRMVIDCFPMFSSTSNVYYLGTYDCGDNAYMVYPGFGFQLFKNTDYSGAYTNIYYNTSTSIA